MMITPNLPWQRDEVTHWTNVSVTFLQPTPYVGTKVLDSVGFRNFYESVQQAGTQESWSKKSTEIRHMIVCNLIIWWSFVGRDMLIIQKDHGQTQCSGCQKIAKLINSPLVWLGLLDFKKEALHLTHLLKSDCARCGAVILICVKQQYTSAASCYILYTSCTRQHKKKKL